MAVVKETIKASLIQLTEQLKTMTDPDEAIDKWADLLADIIKDAITSAEVLPGQTVTTTGTAAAQTGATTTSGTIQ